MFTLISRNAEAWGENVSLREHCAKRKEMLYVIRVEDTIRRRQLTLSEQYALVLAHIHAKRTNSRRKPSSEMLKVAMGAKVMATENVQTDLDLANGARGEVVDIVLHLEGRRSTSSMG